MLRLAKLAWFAQSAMVECISAVIAAHPICRCHFPRGTSVTLRHTHTLSHHPAPCAAPAVPVVGTEPSDSDDDDGDRTGTSTEQHTLHSELGPAHNGRCPALPTSTTPTRPWAQSNKSVVAAIPYQ